jgi:peptide/nickel transport system substrate-binding protein
MEGSRLAKKASRRKFLIASALMAASATAAACAPAAAPTATPAPAKPAEAPKAAVEPTKPAAEAPKPAAAAPTATAAPAAAAPAAKPTEAPKPAAAAPAGGPPKQVARNRTLILMWSGTEGKYVDHELWNRYALGANHQNGLGILHEPVAYYSAFADKWSPWLAESFKYSPDFKELVLKTRSGVPWSDGKPFSAEDVAFTISSLAKPNAKDYYNGAEIQQFVDSAQATDANTVQIKFKVPAPKFYYFISYKFDIGTPIVPKQVFEKAGDWTKFKNFDIAQGLPVTTGPWQVVFATPDQKVIDRRASWWAAAAGLTAMPKVERIVYLPFAGETQVAQAHIANQIDCSLDLRPNTIKQVIVQNPKIITHTGRELPYGYTDWWPTSLYLNTEKKPFDDKDVRWAISKMIDRKQVVEVGYGGAGTLSKLPIPSYPPLKPYFDAIATTLQKYDTNEYNPGDAAKTFEGKGFKKNPQGVWSDAQGNPVKLEIGGFNIFNDIGPVIAEQLKKQGIDTSYVTPPDMFDRFAKGDYTGMLFGHGGSVGADPYFTLNLYKSNLSNVPGEHQANFARWKNDAFDKVTNEMATVPQEDQARLLQLWKQAMEIWLPELPDIQITEWYHRIPMNTTYWKGWPTKDDPYVNGAFWHYTFQLILNKLDTVQ